MKTKILFNLFLTHIYFRMRKKKYEQLNHILINFPGTKMIVSFKKFDGGIYPRCLPTPFHMSPINVTRVSYNIDRCRRPTFDRVNNELIAHLRASG